MYRDELSEEHLFYVCRFTPGGADPKDDYAKHLEGMKRSGRFDDGRGTRPSVMIIQDPGYPPPNAHVRQQVAAMTDDPRFHAVTAIVTTNTVIRGVVTAINWIRRRQSDEQLFSDTASALAWLEKQRGASIPALRRAVEKLTR